MIAALFAVVVYLQVSGPVSALQCDLDTQGAVQLVSTLTTKQIATNRLSNGKLRIIVYGLNQTTFIGQFAVVSDSVNSVDNISTANPNGMASTATVSIINPPSPGPEIGLTGAGRTLSLTRRAGNTSKILALTVNKDDCVKFNGVRVAGGLNCP